MTEARELKAHATTTKRTLTSEPYRKGLLGPPGTGKSECLRWTRRFFEEVLGWTHGVQFQMVAPQHTMALLIGAVAAADGPGEHQFSVGISTEILFRLPPMLTMTITASLTIRSV